MKSALVGCSAEATRRGEFKIIEVEFPYSRGKEFSPRITSNRAGLDRKQYWCVAEALAALRFDPIPSAGPDRVKSYALGEVQPLFPAALLPAWQRAGNRLDRVQSALRSMLPPEVNVTSDGCLHLLGPSLLAGALDKWIDRTAGAQVVDLSHALYERDYALPGDWWIRHRNRRMQMPDEEADEQVCLEKLDVAAGALRRRRKELGQAAGYNVIHAAWTVDAQGRIAGEIGFCLTPEQDDRLHPAAEAAMLRQAVETVLYHTSFGAGQGLRRVVLGWEPEDHLATSVLPAKEPLTRESSAIAAGCAAAAVPEPSGPEL